MIPFNKCSVTELEEKYVLDALRNKQCGDGPYTKAVHKHFKEKLGIGNMLLVTSGSTALDMTALLADIKEGDEVILPSYTFVSTANAFVLRGAKPVFCEIDPKTMNINADKIESLITDKTRAIAPVHYAGVVCDMDKIMDIAKRHNLVVVEDAAQAVGSVYKGKYPAATIGDMGCFSFHETKNYAMGEGGAIVVKDADLLKKAEIIREKGTDRSQFIRGEVDKYSWQMEGSSYLPSDILAAFLLAQTERFDEIMEKRMHVWNKYNDAFEELEKDGKVIRPFIPDYSNHNAHMYYLICSDAKERNDLLAFMKKNGIGASFHYIPLHTAPMGERLGYKAGDLPITEEYAARLIRLPMFADFDEKDIDYVIEKVKSFYE